MEKKSPRVGQSRDRPRRHPTPHSGGRESRDPPPTTVHRRPPPSKEASARYCLPPREPQRGGRRRFRDRVAPVSRHPPPPHDKDPPRVSLLPGRSLTLPAPATRLPTDPPHHSPASYTRAFASRHPPARSLSPIDSTNAGFFTSGRQNSRVIYPPAATAQVRPVRQRSGSSSRFGPSSLRRLFFQVALRLGACGGRPLHTSPSPRGQSSTRPPSTALFEGADPGSVNSVAEPHSTFTLSHSHTDRLPPPPPEAGSTSTRTRTPRTVENPALSLQPRPGARHHLPLHRARRSLPARRSADPTAKATRRNPNQPTRQCVCVLALAYERLSRVPLVSAVVPKRRTLDERTGTEGITRRWGSRYHAGTAIQRPERSEDSVQVHPLGAERTR